MDLLQQNTWLFESFWSEHQPDVSFRPLAKTAHLHGHCHQKAFDQMGDVEKVLRLLPDLEVRPIESSCCGMAGAFGYGKDTADISHKMAELSLLPALREVAPNDLVVADGTSCRHQVDSLAHREALHVVRLMDSCLPE